MLFVGQIGVLCGFFPGNVRLCSRGPVFPRPQPDLGLKAWFSVVYISLFLVVMAGIGQKFVWLL